MGTHTILSNSAKQNWPSIKRKRNGNITYITVGWRSPTIKPKEYAFGCPVPQRLYKALLLRRAKQ